MAAASPPRGVFITGTDTGVGKTIFAASLALFLRSKGLNVGVMKPAESGVDNPAELGPDAKLLSWAAQQDAPAELTSPYRLRAALAPAVAAQQENVKIVPGTIQANFEALCDMHDFVIVEGAGGLMAPVAGGMLIADIARPMQIPLLIVSRPDLGTINHTFLTVFAAQQMQLPLAGYLINRMPENPDSACRTAPHTMASLISADLLGVLPEAGQKSETEMVEALAREIKASPARTLMLQNLGLADLC